MAVVDDVKGLITSVEKAAGDAANAGVDVVQEALSQVLSVAKNILSTLTGEDK